MQAKHIMTRDPACCLPSTTVQDAARLMQQYDCGCVPVVEATDSRRVVGLITDRDIACRGVAEGLDPATVVETIMSADPVCCGEDTELADLVQIMAEEQVRRVPVTDARGCCVGIVSQADLALAESRGVSEREVGRVVEQISRPKHSEREPQLQL